MVPVLRETKTNISSYHLASPVVVFLQLTLTTKRAFSLKLRSGRSASQLWFQRVSPNFHQFQMTKPENNEESHMNICFKHTPFESGISNKNRWIPEEKHTMRGSKKNLFLENIFVEMLRIFWGAPTSPIILASSELSRFRFLGGVPSKLLVCCLLLKCRWHSSTASEIPRLSQAVKK